MRTVDYYRQPDIEGVEEIGIKVIASTPEEKSALLTVVREIRVLVASQDGNATLQQMIDIWKAHLQKFDGTQDRTPLPTGSVTTNWVNN